jgi:hypothetical protein
LIKHVVGPIKSVELNNFPQVVVKKFRTRIVFDLLITGFFLGEINTVAAAPKILSI